MTVPNLKQRPSPNYSPTPISHDLVIVHLMEGGYAGSVEWLCMPRAYASAHLCMNDDGSEFTQLVPLGQKAWAECAFNSRGVSIEAPGFTAHGVADATLKGLAWATAWLLVAYGVPCRWAAAGEGRGFCSHHDLGAAGGSHVDICGVGDTTWMRFEAMVSQQFAALVAAPLPAWALHGAPNPRQVALPTTLAPPTPSHDGAWRAEPGDTHAHPSASKYPPGSIADLQWRLNAAGASLIVDGWWGEKTRNALEAFQTTHGCARVDGIIGPESWRALDAATSNL